MRLHPYRARFLAISALLGLLGIASFNDSARASGNLVKNGDFEINGGQGFIENYKLNQYYRVTTLQDWVNNQTVYPAGYNVVTSLAWLQSQNYYVPNMWGPSPGYHNGNGFVSSPNGGWFVASNGFDNNSPLEQTINDLIVGSTYTLNFEYAHAQEGGVLGDSYHHFEVSFGGETFNTPTVFLPQGQFKGWYNASHQFTATSTTQVLSFLAHGTNGTPPYMLLDAVSLTTDAVPGPVPFLGLGAAYGWSCRLRHRIKASTGHRPLAAGNSDSNAILNV